MFDLVEIRGSLIPKKLVPFTVAKLTHVNPCNLPLCVYQEPYDCDGPLAAAWSRAELVP